MVIELKGGDKVGCNSYNCRYNKNDMCENDEIEVEVVDKRCDLFTESTIPEMIEKSICPDCGEALEGYSFEEEREYSGSTCYETFYEYKCNSCEFDSKNA